jgi:PncC family amidohydrolase
MSLVIAQIDFRHAASGDEVPDLDSCDFPACPVCHTENYNRDYFDAVYNARNLQYEVNVDNLPETLMGEILRARGLKLVTAESCTGGLIGSRITDVAGSSEYFLGAIVAYAYEAKVALLGVSWDTLNAHGAVSRETVLEMARGARSALKVDIAISASGIAGPGGGTIEKPVGTTWIGLATPDGEWAREFHFSGDRMNNKASAATEALKMVLGYLRRAE